VGVVKRRDFLKLSTAPAFIPLLDLYPKQVLEELATKGVADYGITPYGKKCYISTRVVKGPAVIDAIDIVGPDYGPSQGVNPVFAADFSAHLESAGKKLKMIQVSAPSNQLYRWHAEPPGGIILGEGECLKITGENEGDCRWKVFTVYREE